MMNYCIRKVTWIRFLLFIPLLNVSINNTFSQEQFSTTKKSAINKYKDGLYYYENLIYNKAIDLFKEAIEIDTKFIEPHLVMAELYIDAGNTEKAVDFFSKGLAINPNHYPYGFVRLGELQNNLGRYADAKTNFEIFLSLNPTKQAYIDNAKKGIEKAEFGVNAINHPVKFIPENLGDSVNTVYDEYWPSLSADESTMVITRLIPAVAKAINNFQEDFFISSRNDSLWGKIHNAGEPLNTFDNEGAQSISANGRFMVFTACNRKDGEGKCDLYYSYKTGEDWSQPKNMGQPINTVYRETQPTLSPDGRTIYFASNRTGGKGDHDIYVSYLKEDGLWTIPENLGDSINSPGAEIAPYIHQDENTLYFSSNEHMGLGGYDIFYSRKKEDGGWAKPKNLGYPINTFKDEFGLVVNTKGNMAYFASDREPEKRKDIYEFELYKEARPSIVSYFKGIVFDSDTKKPLVARFELIDVKTGKTLNQSFSDPRDGEFLVCIPTNKSYMLNVSKNGYLFYSDNFFIKGNFEKAKPFIKNVPLELIKEGRSIILRNIFFETDSYILHADSKSELSKVVVFLNNNPSVKIEISGHTDNIGTEDYNLKLSDNRAKSVVDYLIKEGISVTRIKHKGYGYSKSVASNDTEEGRAQNRRTELKVITY